MNNKTISQEDIDRVLTHIQKNPGCLNKKHAKLLAESDVLTEAVVKKLTSNKEHTPALFPKTPAPYRHRDPAVVLMLKRRFDIDYTEEKHDFHRKVNSVETAVGNWLEDYIADRTPMIRVDGIMGSTDFLNPFIASPNNPLIQIKNGAFAENADGKGFRDTKSTPKWYRFNGATGKTKWDNFPFKDHYPQVCEDDFIDFLKNLPDHAPTTQPRQPSGTRRRRTPRPTGTRRTRSQCRD